MAVYLISYDILTKNKQDEENVLAVLRKMRAVQCLYSEWLLETSVSAMDVARQLEAVMTQGDRLLVIRITRDGALTDVMNKQESLALIARA